MAGRSSRGSARRQVLGQFAFVVSDRVGRVEVSGHQATYLDVGGAVALALVLQGFGDLLPVAHGHGVGGYSLLQFGVVDLYVAQALPDGLSSGSWGVLPYPYRYSCRPYKAICDRCSW